MKKKQDNDLKNKGKDELQNQDSNCKQESKEAKVEPENEDIKCELESFKEEIKVKDEKIKQCEAIIEEQKDRYLRLQADFDNYRKRVGKEREDIFSSALEDMMLQLLPIIDNFERALNSFRTSGLEVKYIEGLEMIYKDFLGTLSKNGLEEIEALGCEFDPNKHHAVMRVEAGEEDENQIKEIFQKGYMLKAKVIRPSMVKVAINN